MIPDFFIYTRSNPVRNDWCVALGQHPQLSDSEEAFLTLEGTTLFLGASRVHPGLRGVTDVNLIAYCLAILPKYDLFGF